MICDECRDLMVLRIYGELTGEQEQSLQQHVRGCRSCAGVNARIEKIHGVLAVEDDIPQPDWEASWRIIRERALTRKGHGFILFPIKRYAIIAATAAVVFIIGVLAGRSIFFPDHEPPPVDIERVYHGVASLSAYAETLEPVLIDFMNRGGGPESGEMAALTDRVVTDMLSQTRLLKRAAGRSGDRSLYTLLEDIEMVLISIANLRGTNGDVASQLDQVIIDKSIMHRLKRLPKSNPAI
jgi:hypothetical protein